MKSDWYIAPIETVLFYGILAARVPNAQTWTNDVHFSLFFWFKKWQMCVCVLMTNMTDKTKSKIWLTPSFIIKLLNNSCQTFKNKKNSYQLEQPKLNYLLNCTNFRRRRNQCLELQLAAAWALVPPPFAGMTMRM